jgi:hypothetical protein
MIDTTGGKKGRRVLVGGTRRSQSVENPIAKSIPLVQAAIDTLRKKQFDISSRRTEIIAGGKVDSGAAGEESSSGFLDELAVMRSILLSHGEAVFVWTLFFIFFLSIELFILFNKFYDKENDYEYLVAHQMDIRIEQLKALGKDKNILSS